MVWIAGFIEHLRHVTTNGYNTFTSLHTLHVTTAHMKSSQSVMYSLVVVW
jgi:hypothetical protein